MKMRNSSPGFSLIETLVSLTLLTAAFIALSNAIGRGTLEIREMRTLFSSGSSALTDCRESAPTLSPDLIEVCSVNQAPESRQRSFYRVKTRIRRD